MVNGRAMVADLVIQRPKRKVHERRSSAHSLKNALASVDRFMDLEPVPSSFVIAKYFVGGEIEFEDLATPKARKYCPFSFRLEGVRFGSLLSFTIL